MIAKDLVSKVLVDSYETLVQIRIEDKYYEIIGAEKLFNSKGGVEVITLITKKPE